jgi:hypothetical protein
MSSGVSLPNQSFRFSNGDVADIQQIKTFNTGSRTPSSRWCRFNTNQNQQQSTPINTITLRGLTMFRKNVKAGTYVSLCHWLYVSASLHKIAC